MIFYFTVHHTQDLTNTVEELVLALYTFGDGPVEDADTSTVLYKNSCCIPYCKDPVYVYLYKSVRSTAVETSSGC
jgi:hypothetical protein